MMASSAGLLKDGTKHLSGLEEAVLRNIDACKELSKVTRTSLGPHGMKKMVINRLERLFVTSDAATIIKELEVVHPAAKMLVMASQMQEQEMGDGTNAVIVLGGELLLQAESLIRMGLHPSEIVAGYVKAGKKALEVLEGLISNNLTSVRDVTQVAKYLRSSISSKLFGYEDLLAPLIAQACIQTTPEDPSIGRFSVDSVRVVKLVGGGLTDTKLVRGFVTPKDAEGSIKHVKNAKICVFAAGIDVVKPETKPTVLITTADQLMSYNKGEEKIMEEIIGGLAQAGINVFVSGGPVGDIAMHFLERHGIMVVKIGSKFDIRRLCQATGATPLVRTAKPSAEEIGSCDEVSIDEIGGTKVCVFRNEESNKSRSRISTLIVRAATQNILDDVERCIDDAVNTYRGILKDTRFVPGAGSTEIEISRKLESFGESTPGLDQYAIKKYAEAFQIIPRILAENAGVSSIETLSSLMAAHQGGSTDAGIDVDDGSVRSALEMSVFDLYLTKHWAIKLATDVVVTILRIDQIIMAKAAGGPKAPKQGERDNY
eukprot:TRINITY_DN3877_c0_g1_i1.p2 TRINITY_DN3877_c0_g1~~TRINITY_DN3877_c0_g1_i1.p2  ORF type:complete len:553 (+),score=280.00 TRINITY_DN3877_c0_g1_i1:33-1661(+)